MDTINFTNNNENVNKQVSLFWNEERQVIFNWGISAMTPLPSPPILLPSKILLDSIT